MRLPADLLEDQSGHEPPALPHDTDERASILQHRSCCGIISAAQVLLWNYICNTCLVADLFLQHRSCCGFFCNNHFFVFFATEVLL